jgi:hypothetical protein
MTIKGCNQKESKKLRNYAFWSKNYPTKLQIKYRTNIQFLFILISVLYRTWVTDYFFF